MVTIPNVKDLLFKALMLDMEGGRPVCLTEQSFMNKNKKLKRKGKKKSIELPSDYILSSETLLEVFEQLSHALLP